MLASLVSTVAFAANELMQLRPLDLPVVTKWVSPDYVPACYEDTTVIVTMTLDQQGQPHDIKVVEPRDALLDKCMIPALAQCRFSPVLKAGVAVEAKIVLPVKLPLFDEDNASPTQIGALDAVAPRGSQALPPQDRDNHPVVFHVNAVKLGAGKTVADGTTEAAVRDLLGEPEKISATVWAYSSFTGLCDDADNHGCNTVLIAFTDHRVAAIALVNARARTRVVEEMEYFPTNIIERLRAMHQATKVALN